MNETILLVGHGSRDAHGNDEIEAFAAQWRTRQPRWNIEVCFIEFAEVLLDQGMDRAARHGGKVIVVPLVLNAAGHVKMEIPAHIAQARVRNPATEFVYMKHLGAVEPIFQLLKRNLNQVMKSLDMPDPHTTGVLLLGRGSSDKVANGEVAKLARWMFEETDHDLVDIAFTGITYPRVETAVQRHAKLGMTQIAILPYYLYTGTLVERIKRQVDALRVQYPQIRFGLANYFGFEQEIFALVEQRVRAARGEDATPEAGMMECDGCKYRAVAEEHGHGHSHDHAAPPAAHAHPPHEHDHDHHDHHPHEHGIPA